MQRVVFSEVTESILLFDFLQREHRISLQQCQDLTELGAIYSDKKRLFENRELIPGEILRCHLEPKRYSVSEYDWSALVVAKDPDFLVLNKPAGVPVAPTLDNSIECCQFQLKKRGYPHRVTTRLDVPTSGLLVYGNSEEFVTHYNSLMAMGEIKKKYQVFTESPVQLGTFDHYMEKSKRAPKKVFDSPAEGRQLCQLVIEDTQAVENGYVSRVRLVTGRTHQIRVQFQALGHSVFGDTMYGGRLYWKGEKIGLHCESLEFVDRLGETRSFLVAPNWRSQSD